MIDSTVKGGTRPFRFGAVAPLTTDLPTFLSMLPLTLRLEEFNGREKIAYLPRELVHEGSPGSDPEDGDLICYIPWGNIGFYYNTAGIGYSDQTTPRDLHRLTQPARTTRGPRRHRRDRSLTPMSSLKGNAMNPTYDFKGQVALVTGASSGMGLVTAQAASVLWRCSPGASFVVGVALPVDGGYTAR